MVNGAGRVFIEVAGKVQLTNIRFRDNAQLMNICQRIVSQVGRRETATVCGPAGVILSTRTSEGAADNLRSVNKGLVDSGLSKGDVIAAAVKG